MVKINSMSFNTKLMSYRQALYTWKNEGQEKAIRMWQDLAILNNDARSQYQLAVFYETGHCQWLKADLGKSAQLYREAACSGLINAMLRLSQLLFDLPHLARNSNEAAQWLRLAAKSGHAEAQFQLALRYDTGYDLPPDEQQAVYWYQQACLQNHAKACSNLARCFVLGNGVKPSFAKAFHWFGVAHALGLHQARFHQERISKKLDPITHHKALRLLQKWLKKRHISLDASVLLNLEKTKSTAPKSASKLATSH